jgi:hypothetical protein
MNEGEAKEHRSLSLPTSILISHALSKRPLDFSAQKRPLHDVLQLEVLLGRQHSSRDAHLTANFPLSIQLLYLVSINV